MRTLFLLLSLAATAPVVAAVPAGAETLACQTINGRTECQRGTGNMACQSVNGRMTCMHGSGAQSLSCTTVNDKTTCSRESVPLPAPNPDPDELEDTQGLDLSLWQDENGMRIRAGGLDLWLK